MKFGQSIEYNMWNIFAEKSYTKCAGKNYSQTDTYLKIKTEQISGSIAQSFKQFVST